MFPNKIMKEDQVKKNLSFLIVFAFTLCFLLSCGGNPSDTSTVQSMKLSTDYKNMKFDKENFPVLDGSTANIPLAKLIIQRLLEISGDEADALINFHTTPAAYEQLAHGLSDLLLVYNPADATKKTLADRNVELEYHSIGRDALVFIVNEQNPITSLTTKQVQDIYTGKIKNWKELGGKDLEIVAFQRPETSGSQALMDQLIMKNLTKMQAPVELIPAGMGGLIEGIASYKNTGGAIGYSVFYYADTMYKTPGLKFIKIDDVAPSNESIANGAYPHTNDFYAVINKNENRANVINLLNWILSEEGKKAITDAGYVWVEDKK